jgi:nitrite reductase/ring-hydroxylating ferredoxin subunit
LDIGEDGMICRSRDLGEAETLKFRLPGGIDEGFLLRREGRVTAYINICPHWGVPLDYADNRFYEPRAGRIICRNHGAEFEPDRGQCVAGPAKGDHLHLLPIREENGVIFLLGHAGKG